MGLVLYFLIFVVVVAVALYLVKLIPMDATLKQVIKVIVIASVVICALYLFVPPLLHFAGHLK